MRFVLLPTAFELLLESVVLLLLLTAARSTLESLVVGLRVVKVDSFVGALAEVVCVLSFSSFSFLV